MPGRNRMGLLNGSITFLLESLNSATQLATLWPVVEPQESLERLWTYTYEGAMLRYLKSWTLQRRWERLPAFEKLAHMLIG